jgi:hypothetical protein
MVHVLFLAAVIPYVLLPRRTFIQHGADDCDDNRYDAHPENGPDYQ